MNTRKQVLIMTSLLLMMLIVIGAYAAWDPSRADDAALEFDEEVTERGSILFARNCRLCHGNLAEGGVLGARLPSAPALNRPDLQGFLPSGLVLSEGLDLTSTRFVVDVVDEEGSGVAEGDVILIDGERMEVEEVDGNEVHVKRAIEHTDAGQHFASAQVFRLDQSAFDTLNPNSTFNVIRNTLACGRVGSAMPAWGIENGGPLSDEQIRQLTLLIMQGRWDLVEHEIDIEDAIASELEAPIAADATEMVVSDVSRFMEDEALRIGGERVRVVSVPELPTNRFGELPDDRSGVIGIERGVLGTAPLEHSADTELYRFAEVAEPSINERACGQSRVAAPTGPCPVSDGVVQLTAINIAFNCTEIVVDAGSTVTISFENQEGTPHNIAVYEDDTAETPIADGSVGEIFSGPGMTQEISFDAPPAGDYFFRCDVHPTQMVGEFIVQ